MRNSWNVMDGFLVLVSWIDVIVSQTTKTESSILGVLRVFRALRTLRPLRLVCNSRSCQSFAGLIIFFLNGYSSSFE